MYYVHVMYTPHTPIMTTPIYSLHMNYMLPYFFTMIRYGLWYVQKCYDYYMHMDG